jgi:hypothetical protein
MEAAVSGMDDDMALYIPSIVVELGGPQKTLV